MITLEAEYEDDEWIDFHIIVKGAIQLDITPSDPYVFIDSPLIDDPYTNDIIECSAYNADFYINI